MTGAAGAAGAGIGATTAGASAAGGTIGVCDKAALLAKTTASIAVTGVKGPDMTPM
jgi:hypothetical protein